MNLYKLIRFRSKYIKIDSGNYLKFNYICKEFKISLKTIYRKSFTTN